MTEYHKIETCFERDPETNFKTLIEGKWANETFEYLANNQWEFTEKVDGTNNRVIAIDKKITFGGKEANSQIDANLTNVLIGMFYPQADKIYEMFPGGVVLYGEGYGAKIQKGGGNYRQDQSFVLFDVYVLDPEVGGWWLSRTNILDVASKLDLHVVPLIGRGTLPEMVEMVRAGYPSMWSTDKNTFMAEGIVAKPAVEVKNRKGKRVITKIKHKDFTRAKK